MKSNVPKGGIEQSIPTTNPDSFSKQRLNVDKSGCLNIMNLRFDGIGIKVSYLSQFTVENSSCLEGKIIEEVYNEIILPPIRDKNCCWCDFINNPNFTGEPTIFLSIPWFVSFTDVANLILQLFPLDTIIWFDLFSSNPSVRGASYEQENYTSPLWNNSSARFMIILSSWDSSAAFANPFQLHDFLVALKMKKPFELQLLQGENRNDFFQTCALYGIPGITAKIIKQEIDYKKIISCYYQEEGLKSNDLATCGTLFGDEACFENLFLPGLLGGFKDFIFKTADIENSNLDDRVTALLAKSTIILHDGIITDIKDIMNAIQSQCLVRFGENDIRTIMATNNLAVALMYDIRYQESEELFYKLLNTTESVFRVESEIYCIINYYYCQSLIVQAKLIEVEPILSLSYHQCSAKFGPEHLLVIMKANQLARVLSLFGKFDQSSILFNGLPDLTEKYCGKNHCITFQAKLNFADFILNSAQNRNESEDIYKYCLTRYKELYGDGNFRTIDLSYRFGLFYLNQRQYDLASSMLCDSLNKCKTLYGPEHPLSLKGIKCCIEFFQAQGMLGVVESFLQLFIPNSVLTNGPYHPATLHAMEHLAVTFQNQGKLNEAEIMYRQCVESFKIAFGEDDPKPLMTLIGLGKVLTDTFKLAEAQLIMKECASKSKALLGERHPQTLIAINNLGMIEMNLGNYADALTIFEDMVGYYKSTLTATVPCDPQFLVATNNLAMLYLNLGRSLDAEQLLGTIIPYCVQALGESHPQTLAMMNNLATILNMQGRFLEAAAVFAPMTAPSMMPESLELSNQQEAISDEDQGFNFNQYFLHCNNLDIRRIMKWNNSFQNIHDEHYPRNNKLTIFVSSTFTDTYRERDILHQVLLPQLQSESRLHGLEMNFYDMRFGVKDENTVDHLTWIACRDGIQQCSDESDGLFFLSLQANKYGYMPLPKYIDQVVFDQLLTKKEECLQVNDDELARKVIVTAREWYQLDENAFPNRRYQLKNLSSVKDSVFWNEVLPLLTTELFDSVCFEELPNQSGDTVGLLVNRSVTEWETLFALALSPSRCCWIPKSFHNDDLKDYVSKQHPIYGGGLCDITSSSKQMKLDILISKMKSLLDHSTNILTLKTMPSTGSYLSNNTLCQEYLQEWQDSVRVRLLLEISNFNDRKRHAKELIRNQLYLSSEDFEEISHHRLLMKMNSSEYIKRDERDSLIHTALETILTDTGMISQSKFNISLAILGSSGTGKTVLLSKLASIIHLRSATPTIIRFCGTTPASSNARDLIYSITMELFSLQMSIVDGNIEESHEKPKSLQDFLENFRIGKYQRERLSLLLTDFYLLMTRNNISAHLFLDGIENIINQDELSVADRDCLSFLNGGETMLDPNFPFKSIISTADKTVTKRLMEDPDCPKLTVTSIESKSDQLRLLEKLLQKQKQRKLTSLQLNSLSHSLGQQPLPFLYLQLALEIVSKWTSFLTDTNQLSLPSTLKDLINQIFHEYERDFGIHFTSYAFAFITYSRYGVSDSEMRDLLSLQEEYVLKEIFQYSSLAFFPIHVWLRLKSNLKKGNLIRESKRKNMNGIQWNYSALIEVARERYEHVRRNSHEIMATYFGNAIDGTIRTERQIQTQPLVIGSSSSSSSIWFPNAIVNERRILETYYHLLQCEKEIFIDKLLKELTNLEVICGVFLLHDGHEFLQAIIHVLYTSPFYKDYWSVKGNDVKGTSLESYYRWLRSHAQELRMGNPRQKIPGSITAESVQSIARNDWIHYMNTCDVFTKPTNDQEKEPIDFSLYEITFQDKQNPAIIAQLQLPENDNDRSSINDMVWNDSGTMLFETSRFGGKIHAWDPFTGQVMKLFGSSSTFLNEYQSIRVSKDNQVMAAISKNCMIEVWDIETSSEITTIQTNENKITRISCSLDNELIALGGADSTITIWNTLQSRVVCYLQGHLQKISAFAWGPSSSDSTRLLASGSEDATIIIWDAIDDGRLLHRLKGHSSVIRVICWNKTGDQFITGSGDGKRIIWNTVTGEMIFSLETEFQCLSISLSDDERKLFVGRKDSMMEVWDLLTKEMIQTIEAPSRGIQKTAICYDSYEDHCIAAYEDNTIIIWNLLTQSIEQTFIGCFEYQSSCLVELLLKVSPDRSRFALADHKTKVIKIYDLITGSILCELSYPDQDKNLLVFCWYDNDKIICSPDTYVETSFICHLPTSDVNDSTRSPWKIPLPNRKILSMEWFPMDHSIIAVGLQNSFIDIWDISSDRHAVVCSYKLSDSLDIDDNSSVVCLSWHRDGYYLAGGTSFGELILCEYVSGKQKGRILYWLSSEEVVSSSIVKLFWSNGGDQLLSVSRNGQITMYSLSVETNNSQEPLQTMFSWVIPSMKGVQSAIWSSDERSLIVSAGQEFSSDGGIIEIWELESRSLLFHFKESKAMIPTLAYHVSMKNQFVTGDSDGLMKFWDLDCLLNDHQNPSKAVENQVDIVSIDYFVIHEPTRLHRIISLSSNHILKTWDMEGISVLSSFQVPSYGQDNSVCMKIDRSTNKLAILQESRVLLYQLPSFILISSSLDGLSIAKDNRFGYFQKLTDCCWNVDGTRLAVVGYQDDCIRIWDPSNQMIVAKGIDVSSRATVVAWNKKNRLASGHNDNRIIIWDTTTTSSSSNKEEQITKLFILSDHTGFITSLVWSDNDQELISGSADRSMKFWSGTTGELLRTIDRHPHDENNNFDGSIASIAVTPPSSSSSASSLIALSAGNEIFIWNQTEKKIVHVLHGHSHEIQSLSWFVNNISGVYSSLQLISSSKEDGVMKCWKTLNHRW